jgi:hypothetical protein
MKTFTCVLVGGLLASMAAEIDSTKLDGLELLAFLQKDTAIPSNPQSGISRIYRWGNGEKCIFSVDDNGSAFAICHSDGRLHEVFVGRLEDLQMRRLFERTNKGAAYPSPLDAVWNPCGDGLRVKFAYADSEAGKWFEVLPQLEDRSTLERFLATDTTAREDQYASRLGGEGWPVWTADGQLFTSEVAALKSGCGRLIPRGFVFPSHDLGGYSIPTRNGTTEILFQSGEPWRAYFIVTNAVLGKLKLAAPPISGLMLINEGNHLSLAVVRRKDVGQAYLESARIIVHSLGNVEAVNWLYAGSDRLLLHIRAQDAHEWWCINPSKL